MLFKLSRQTLSEQAARNLIEYIEAGNLKPGDILPSESKLASSFGVSRPVIREALRSLAGNGLIEVINGKGAIIKPVDSDPLRRFFRRAIIFDGDAIIELLEVRKGLEVQTASLAAERRTDEELAQMGQDIAAMREQMYDPEKCIESDLQFHLKIARSTHNLMAYYLLESIRDSTKNTILEGRLSRKTDEELERVQVLHEMIYAAIEAGNAEQAANAMITHFDEAVLAVTKIKRLAAS